MRRWSVEGINIMGGSDSLLITRSKLRARFAVWLINLTAGCKSEGCSGCTWVELYETEDRWIVD